MPRAAAGTLYLAAGGYHLNPALRPEDLLTEILSDIGVTRPCIADLGSANGDSPRFHRMMAGAFAAAGAGRTVLAPTASGRADIEAARRILSDADIVFVSGGDVEAGMRVLEAAALVPFLRSLHKRGKAFIGLSAGTIMLGQSWVRWPDPENDTGAERFPCLGLASLSCDTHEEADDWPELKTFLQLASARTVGYGITAGAALRVAPDGTLAALGGSVHRLVHKGGGTARLSDLLPYA